MPDYYSNLSGADDDMEGYDPTDPFSALSSRNALVLSGNPPAGNLPAMPAQQRAAQLAQDPNLTKVVQPSAWRMGLGLAAQWLSPRRVGPAVNQILTSTDPQVRAHQELLNKYQIAEQQAQQERQMMGTYGNLLLRQKLAEGIQGNRASQASARLASAGAEPIESMSMPPPVTPPVEAQAPTISQPKAPELGQPSPPPVIGPGAQPVPPGVATAMQANAAPMTSSIANFQKKVDPLTGERVQVPPASEKNLTVVVSKELAEASGHPELALQRVTDADQRELLSLAQRRATVPSAQEPLKDRVPQLNQMLQQRWNVLHPGEPMNPAYTLAPNATKEDYDRVEKSLAGEESALGTKAQRDAANELRKQTMALAAENRQGKQDTSLKQTAYKTYTPALDSAERFNVMTKNFEDAVKSHDQQAMLSLLANHLGMTMGLQKGSRLTKDIIQEAQHSRPFLQGMVAKFDNQGYLSGVTLTPQQMQQMVSLGRERFAEDLTKSRNEAQYLGVTDDGPKRTPNRSTINFYMALANGDMNKAKQLAATDGWSIQ